ncbi:hypothetical protein RN001_007193 [Aquatica leii]|uniref:Uncharacterized protein n=1 Tax=Aquatica leii TaxID=1421715 RepID=A0AAN7SF34_9COLE|nr:hypothetical protein RN001_007193 [Aquatica leii]
MTRGTTEIKAETSSLTPSQALALYLDLDLSEKKYKVLKSVTICQLQNSHFTMDNGQECHVSYEFLFTMMDGSVSNVLSDINNAAKCMICGATLKDMNTRKVLTGVSHAENYRFGLSTLHSYRLPIKSWQLKGNKNKEVINMNKTRIQADFKSKISLLVDKPKPGYGSTNDGNTARKFFTNTTGFKLTPEPWKWVETYQSFSLHLHWIISTNAIQSGPRGSD